MRKTALKTIAIMAATLALVVPASAYKGEKLANSAKIKIEQARTTALKACAGKITDEELEREKGGSGLRYTFDIQKDGKTYEVGVDAVTGKVLENAPEGSNPD
jgi:uncharacterized membrane protein YkoI